MNVRDGMQPEWAHSAVVLESAERRAASYAVR